MYIQISTHSKGIPYIIVPNERAGFSFGVVFFGENQQNKNLVRHEYGHTVQLRKKGPAKYVGSVMIPSVLVYWFLYAPGTISEEEYYSLPWESEANRYGRVIM